MDNSIGIPILCICTFLIFISIVGIYLFEQHYPENPCSKRVIKNHILSLSEDYTDAEKDRMVEYWYNKMGCS